MSKTILVLAANPKDTPGLRLDEEVREIDSGLRRAEMREEFSLKQTWAARPVDVRRAMLDFKPNIVHFCGHGSGEEGIAFEDEAGNSKLVNAETLAEFFELFADKLECVVLNACFSEIQAKAVAKHVPNVIGMKKSVGDIAAIEFSVAFYDALGAGKSIEFAYKLACNAIRWSGLPEELTPILISSSSSQTYPKDQVELNLPPVNWEAASPQASGHDSSMQDTLNKWNSLKGNRIRIEPLYAVSPPADPEFIVEEVIGSAVSLKKVRRGNIVCLPLDCLSTPWYAEDEGYRATIRYGELREFRDNLGFGVWRWQPLSQA